MPEEGQHLSCDESDQQPQPKEHQEQGHLDNMIMMEGMKEDTGYSSLAMTLPDPSAGMLTKCNNFILMLGFYLKICFTAQS